MMLRTGGLALVAGFFVSLGCSSDIDIGQNLGDVSPAGMGGAGAMPGTGGSDAGSGAAGSGGDCQVTHCQGKEYECGNCSDDDGDGSIDASDVHCTGPCDDSEATFAIDIREGTGPACKMDCFFDGDVGSGNDDCNWSHRCDPYSIAEGNYPPSGDPACAYDETAPIPGMATSCQAARDGQGPMCADICGPLVPNGCDCFGCCELPAASGHYVWLGSESAGAGTCSIETLDEETACRPCTPVGSCLNECEACEACVGRTGPDPSCGSGAPPPCPTGMAACDVDIPSCGPGAYCITGCCVPEPR